MRNEKRVSVSKQSIVRGKYLEQFASARISRLQVAETLGLSQRQVSRIASRWNEEGVLGLEHRLSGTSSARRTSQELIDRVRFLFTDKYVNFNFTHFHEMLAKNENIRLRYSTIKRICSKLGATKRPKRKHKIRRYRDRLPSPGMMFQMDGSDHEWTPGKRWCLIAGIDDATSDVPYGEFFSTESMDGYLQVLSHVFELRGVPQVLYVDQAAWLSGTAKTDMTGQFRRICDELGIAIIFANSAQAKGRIERLWQTFQDRLVAEMGLHKLTEMNEATAYLNNTFLPETWNARFTLPPTKPDVAYRPAPTKAGIADTFTLKYSRKIRNDHTFNWNNNRYKITSKLRFSLVRQNIEIRLKKSGEFTINHSGKVLEYSRIVMPHEKQQTEQVYKDDVQGKNRVLRPYLLKNTERHFY